MKVASRLFWTSLFVGLALHQVPPSQFLPYLRQVDGFWLLVSVMLMAATVILNSWKWWLLFEVFDARPGYFRLLHHYAVGYFFNSFITGTGDVRRAAVLGAEEGRPAEAAASVIVERWTGVIGQLAVAGVTLFVAALQYRQLMPLVLFCSSLALVMMVLYIWLEGGRSLAGAEGRSDFWGRVHVAIGRVRGSLALYKGSRGVLGGACLLSLGAPVILVLVHYTLGRALGFQLSLLNLFLFIPTVSVFAQMPISINGLGLQDYSMVQLLALGGVTGGISMALSVAFHLLRLGTGGLGGLLYLIGPAASSPKEPAGAAG